MRTILKCLEFFDEDESLPSAALQYASNALNDQRETSKTENGISG